MLGFNTADRHLNATSAHAPCMCTIPLNLILEGQSAPGSLSPHNLLILLCWSQSSLGVWRTGACTNAVPGKWAGGQTTSAVPPGTAAIAYPVCSQAGCSAWHIAVCLLLHLPLGSQAGWKPHKSIIPLSHTQQFLVPSIGCFDMNFRLSLCVEVL